MLQVLTRKNIIWMVALAVTAWLTWQTYQQEHEMSVVNPVRAVVRGENVGGIVKTANLDEKSMTDSFELVPRVKDAKPYFNLFAAPARKIEEPAVNFEPVVPVAPVLPFKYLGAVTEMNETKVILEHHGDVVAVKVGDNFGVNYKLLSINKVANNAELVFLFLPMNITQTMVVSDVSEQ